MRKLILLLCMTMLCIVGQAQDDSYMTRGRAAARAGGEQLETFKKEIAQMAQSKKESVLINALYGYYGLGDKESADALSATIKKKFPRGIVARGSAMQELFNIEGAAAKEKAYNALLKKFPAKKLGQDASYDQAAYAVASAYVKEGNVAKAIDYVHQCKDSVWTCIAYNYIASQLNDAGHKTEAGQLLKEGSEAADKVVPSLKGYQKAQAAAVYGSYADWLADNGKADEAWQLYNSKVTQKERSLGYWKLALQHGQVMQAWTYLDGLLRKGYINSDGEAVMREAWQKANGNADGFDAYIKQANEDRVAEKLAKLPEQMVKKPAPDFTLKDIDGNTVQLSKLRGKVVVLDFWATWCGPCKRSLPAMKKTLAKYKDDPDVVFLFIHTWERGTAEEANKEAKAYLDDNGFSEFHLVMDTADPETKTNKAVSAFGVRGIPAKFVIDKEGNIRFEISGFGGSDDDAVAELSAMIELAKKAK